MDNYLEMSIEFSKNLEKLEEYYNQDKMNLKEYYDEKNRIIGVFINYSKREIENNNNVINKL